MNISTSWSRVSVWVSGLGLGLVKQAQQQGVSSAGLADITQVAGLQGLGLGGELPDFRVRNPAKERPGIESGIQLGEPVDPQAQVLQICWPWGLLEPREAIHVVPVRQFQ